VVTHKLRSFLTILGVVIGVAAVIILMSVGKGTTANIVSNLSTLGTNFGLYISWVDLQWRRPVGFGSASTLTLEDANAIAEQVANIVAVAPTRTSGSQVMPWHQHDGNDDRCHSVLSGGIQLIYSRRGFYQPGPV